MRKSLLILCGVVYATLGYSQRYTGYGRGLDWEDFSIGKFFGNIMGGLEAIWNFLVIAFVVVGVIFTLMDKIKEFFNPNQKENKQPTPKNIHTESPQEKIIKPTTPIAVNTTDKESSCSRKMPSEYSRKYILGNPSKVSFTSLSKNLEVLKVTNEQKCALFGIIFMMSSYKSLEKNKIKAFKIAKEFADDIKLNKEDYIRISSQLSFPSRYDYSNIIKGIESNVHINMMFAAWKKLVSLDNDNSPVFERLKWMCRELHLSKEEYQKVINGKSL